VRHDVLERNPVRDAASTAFTSRSSPRALTVDEVRLLRARFAVDRQAVARDLPDLVDFLLATGVRIGEASAVTWNEVHLGVSTTVDVTGTVVRLREIGLVLRPSPKTRAGRRTLLLPTWGGALLARRCEVLNGTGPVIPAPWAAPGVRATRRQTCGTPWTRPVSLGRRVMSSERQWQP